MRTTRLPGLGALVALMLAGCSGETSAPVEDPSNEETTGILIRTPAGSVARTYSAFDATGTTMLYAALSMGQVQSVAPGRYVLTAYLDQSFVYATGVVVVAGATTRIEFGAVNLVTVAGSEEATYDIYGSTGQLLTRAQSDNTILPLPPGTFDLTAYFNAPLVYGDNVVVTAGNVTTVTLGAFELTAGTDWVSPTYDIFAANGSTLLARPEWVNTLVPMPAGTYVVKDYFNDLFPYATGVRVNARETTRFAMGAILYTGIEPVYDVYDASGTQLLDRAAFRNDKLPVPPGTFVLKDYFSDVVLAVGVTAASGQVTTVP